MKASVGKQSKRWLCQATTINPSKSATAVSPKEPKPVGNKCFVKTGPNVTSSSFEHKEIAAASQLPTKVGKTERRFSDKRSALSPEPYRIKILTTKSPTKTEVAAKSKVVENSCK
jgi:hypothetical protein